MFRLHTQRQIKLESAACPRSLINDFVTFIGIRKERRVGREDFLELMLIIHYKRTTGFMAIEGLVN